MASVVCVAVALVLEPGLSITPALSMLKPSAAHHLVCNELHHKDCRQLLCYMAQFPNLSPHLIVAHLQVISVAKKLLDGLW